MMSIKCVRYSHRRLPKYETEPMPTNFFKRGYRKLRALAMYPSYRAYLAGIVPSSPLHGIPSRMVGDASADPTEFLDHYAAFAYWATAKIAARARSLKLLDLGSPKMFNSMSSASHEVTSVVLADCGDTISRVNYVRHDVTDGLPFPDASFDVFTSTVSLPLLGLSRYGDRLDPNCLPRLVAELSRVMKPDGEMLVSMCLGRNVLNFNNGWFFDMKTIERLFVGWTVIDCLVDMASSTWRSPPPAAARFSSDTSVDDMPFGHYRVVFLHLRRNVASAS